MPLERNIEAPAVGTARHRGYEVIKIGRDGWPDDLVLLGDGRHFWWEFKRPEGCLRKAQEIRSELIRDAGDTLYVPRSYSEALEQLDEQVRLYRRGLAVAGGWRR